MNTRTVLLTPIDAWFFRDGRPYNQGESGQTEIPSIFPPFAPTVVGTLRAALAFGQGWSGKGCWADELHVILGNGFDDLGTLQFHGPFLMRDGTCLFPVPLHLLGCVADQASFARACWSPTEFLAPNLTNPPMESDLGAVHFPTPIRTKRQRESLKEPAGLWITEAGYSSILRGRIPDVESIVLGSSLWKMEQRVGLARTYETRAAKDGELYSPEYVRLLQGVKLAVFVEGVPQKWEFPSIIALGGESRMAQCESRAAELVLPQLPVNLIRESNRFAVSLLSPLLLPRDSSGRLTLPRAGQSFPSLPRSTIVSACVGKPVHIGGWNSLIREPLPLIPYLPAGSTWFCEVDPSAIDSVLTSHGRHVGEKTPYGFGQIALGAWPQTGDTA